ncbi:hypothetical protein K1T71_011820 [Dendrolimus kikuchii]|uniref:Uncharacterized protein n=1 Tax=Dendrolimus kikuchii TaxID=765133 RepID=A0ACC1CM80_9NEOP|nr:hypothetical protein K1T71_011820 [Dendrolimus kikuchii]
MVKCQVCNKPIVKKSPGLECGKCKMTIHTTNECSGMTAKQITALKASNNMNWHCNTCTKSLSKRSSIIIPDEDGESQDEDETTTDMNITSLDIKKLLKDITEEVRTIVASEIAGLNESLDFMNEKFDTFQETLRNQQKQIKILENKNLALENKNKHLELKIGALEQKQLEIEQNLLSNYIEVAGIPKNNLPDDEVIKMIEKILKVNGPSIESVKRSPDRGTRPGSLFVEISNKKLHNQWLSTAKKTELLLGDVLENVPTELASYKIHIRKALTPTLKSLLWQTKQKLSSTYKYIWCDKGKILLRKDDSSKVAIIRSEEDINNLIR